MARKLLVCSVIALLVIGLALFLFLRRDGHAPSLGDRERTSPPAPAAPPEALTPSPVPAAVNAADAEPDAAHSQDPAAVAAEAAPPLLRGRVLGEGVGIPGATLRFFGLAAVEGLFRRLEELGSGAAGGEIPEAPDIPRLVEALRGELERFRGLGVRVDTGENGEFEAGPESQQRLEPGTYLVLTTAAGWLFRYGEVVCLELGRTEELVVELDRGGSISGRVVGTSGEGVAGAVVAAEIRPAGMPGVGRIVRRVLSFMDGSFLRGALETTTSADGSFTLSSLPYGAYDLAAAQHGVEARLAGVETGATGAVILLGDGARIGGAFTDGAGVPLSGIHARLERLDDRVQLPLLMAGFGDFANTVNRFLGQAPRSAVSDPTGIFSFGALGAGAYRLSVEEPGFLRFSREVSADWGEDKSLGLLTLERGARISGVVRGEDGAALADAVVVASPAKMSFLNMGGAINDFAVGRLRVKTGDDGSFRLEGLAPGQYRLTVSCRGFASEVKNPVRAAAEPAEPVEVRLVRGRTLRGRVVEAAGRTPVRDASVSAGKTKTRTDADGNFVLEGVAPQRADTENPFAEMAPSAESTSAPEDPSQVKVALEAKAKGYLAAEEEFAFGSLPAEVEFSLVRAPEVRGVVLDPEGNPAMGAVVRLSPAMPPEAADLGFFDTSLIFLAATVSNLEGEFRFANISAGQGSKFRVIADHVAWSRGSSEPFELDRFTEPDARLEVRLLEGGTVKGSVGDGASPVSGATLRLRKQREKRPRENNPAEMFTKMLGLPPGGKVAHSNSRGEFLYTQIEPGEYVITAEVAGFQESPEKRVNVAAGKTETVDFVLDPGGTIAGQATDSAGAPLGGVAVRVFRDEAGDEMMREVQRAFGGGYKSARADDEGRFAVVGLPPGKYTLLGEKRGHVKAELRGVEPGPATRRLVLDPAALVRGRVLDQATSAPLKTFRVKLLPKDEGEKSPAGFFRSGREFSDADGAFQLDDVAPGAYTISVSSAAYLTLRVELNLGPGEVHEREYPLRGAGRIRGVVTELSTGRPVAGAKVFVRPQTDGSPAPAAVEERRVAGARGRADEPAENGIARADREAVGQYFSESMTEEAAVSAEDGSFLLESVAEEPQVLAVSHPEFVAFRREKLQVAPGEERLEDVALDRGLELEGRLRDSSGSPVAGAFLVLREAASGTPRVRKGTRTNPEGAFRFAGLPRGTYRVVLASGRAATTDGSAFDVSLDRCSAFDISLDQSRSDVELVGEGPESVGGRPGGGPRDSR